MKQLKFLMLLAALVMVAGVSLTTHSSEPGSGVTPAFFFLPLSIDVQKVSIKGSKFRLFSFKVGPFLLSRSPASPSSLDGKVDSAAF